MAPVRALRPQPLILGTIVLLLLGAVWFGQRTKLAGTRERFSIVCTFLPVYVLTLNVVGELPVDVELLMPANSGCPHDYAVRSQDLKRIANADIIVANGLGVDAFVESLTRSGTSARMMTISDDCELIKSEHCTHTDHAHHHHDHEEHVNGHVWVSPVQAIRQVRTLAAKLAGADPQRAEQYAANAKAYIERLEAISTQMKTSAEHFTHRNIVTLHDSFDYLARDLNLNVVATLTLDPEHSPSAKQMTDAVDIIQRENVAAIFHEPAYSDRLAKSIGSAAAVPVYTLNPMTSVEGPITAQTYEDVMRQNLTVLERALGKKP